MNTPTKAPSRPVAAPLLDPKALASLQARAALVGLQVFRSHPADGPQRLLVEHHGVVRHVRSLDDLEAVVLATGGTA